MKVIALILTIAFATPVFARIGETIEQLNKRYGKPLEAVRDTLETRRYLFRGFTIVVGLENGVSQCEVFRKEDDSRMTEGEIHGLLQANSGPSEWIYEAKESARNYVYASKDKKTRIAIYNLPTHRLMITSKECLARCSELVNASDRKLMDGF